MNWPNWIKDRTSQSVFGIIVTIIFGFAGFLWSSGNSQHNTTTGSNNYTAIVNGNNNTVVQGTVDTDAIVNELAKKLKENSTISQAEIQAIKALKETVERMKRESGDDLRQQALKALTQNETKKAVALMEQAANNRSQKLAYDWVDIGNIAFFYDSYKALQAYQKAINLDPSNPAAWNRSGLILHRLARLNEAKRAYQKVIELAGKDLFLMAVAYGNLGNIHLTRDELENAEVYYQKSLSIYKELGLREGIASGYNNLGLVYFNKTDFNKAEYFYTKSLEVFASFDHKGYLLASVYSNLGLVYESRGDLIKAEGYYLKSLEIYSKNDIKEGIAANYSYLGNVYGLRDDFDKAENYYQKSLEINENFGNKEGKALNYTNLATLAYRQGNMPKACKLWDTSHELFKQIGGKKKVAKIRGWITDYCHSDI